MMPVQMMMVQVMLPQLRPGLVHRRHEGSHRLLVTLEAVRLLQLSQAGAVALLVALALRPGERLPGSLLLHEIRPRCWPH